MIMKAWKILDSKTVYENSWMKLVVDRFAANGKKSDYAYIVRMNGSAVVVEDNDNKIWLVQQYRLPVGRFLWQLPAEGMSGNESFEEAAKRGVEEEVGFGVGKLTALSKVVYPDPGSIKQKTQYFLAQNLENIKNVEKIETGEDEVEQIEARPFSLEEVDKMVENGDICDNWTLTGLYLYRRFLEKNK